MVVRRNCWRLACFLILVMPVLLYSDANILKRGKNRVFNLRLLVNAACCFFLKLAVSKRDQSHCIRCFVHCVTWMVAVFIGFDDPQNHLGVIWSSLTGH